MKKEDSKSNCNCDNNSCGTISVAFGILGILFSSLIGVVLGVIGLLFSLKQKKIAPNKWSKAGFILNIISMIIGLVAFTFILSKLVSSPEFISQIKSLNNG